VSQGEVLRDEVSRVARVSLVPVAAVPQAGPAPRVVPARVPGAPVRAAARARYVPVPADEQARE
jgi:hypothetical protein